jgi:hypothetical protein
MLAGCAVGKRKMLCVGCPTEAFHTLEDVARVYGIAMEQLLRELREAINSSGNNEWFYKQEGGQQRR